jgi:hypothetical protein
VEYQINGGSASKLRVRVDLVRLRSNLTHEDGRDNNAVRRWLIEAGFLPEADDWWLVREDDLGHLEPSEVLDVVGMSGSR